MHPADTTHDHPPSGSDTTRSHPRGQRRLIALFCVLLLILLLNFLPPLLNITRFQRRIASNIGASLGRPVQFKHVALTLLPLPGVTLEDFVVDEDPAFGFEPILRAGQVRATLRITSLWRRRIEFSSISLSAGEAGIAPSVNLVHLADGRWNVEPILLQASRTAAAPTAQRYSSPAPRFPYIEATGARLNLKLDRNGIQEKTPFALTDADFALWLPGPRQWHLRLEARPVRTDIGPADTGVLRIEGTLGGNGGDATPAAPIPTQLAQVPIDLRGEWQDIQLGGLSRLLLGRDASLRGDLAVSARVLGTVGQNAIATSFTLDRVRRADFIPPHPLSLEAACNAAAQDTFHSFPTIECHWPPPDSSGLSVLILSASLPDIRRPRSANAIFTLPALPADTLLDWLSVATPHPPTGLSGPGTLAGAIAWHPLNSGPPDAPNPRPQRVSHRQSAQPQPAFSGELEFSGELLYLPALGPKPIPLGDLLLRSTPPPAASSPHSARPTSAGAPPAASFDLLPISLPLGGRQPATLEGHFDSSGYTLHLTGTVLPERLLALGDAIPQFGDGLRQLLAPQPATPTPDPNSNPDSDSKASPTPIHLDLTATRAWGGPQVWRPSAPPPTHRNRR